jgi:hypothetical protein
MTPEPKTTRYERPKPLGRRLTQQERRERKETLARVREMLVRPEPDDSRASE